MANFYLDNEDLRYYVEKGIDWNPIVELTEYMFQAEDGFKDTGEAVDFYKDILNLIGEFSAEEIAPHVAQLDREGVDFKDGEAVFPERLAGIFEKFKALELHGMCLPRELGGQNCPLTLLFLGNEMIARSDISVMTHHSFHGPMAMAMLVYSMQEGSTEWDREKMQITKTRFADAIERIRKGDDWGSMDITEPNAGSDMAQLGTTAEQDENGNWFVTGQKIFITSGHGRYHFVIARTEKAGDPEDPFAGLGGLSMFLVEAYHEVDGKRVRTVTIDRLEEKMGHHASATASLVYDRSPAHLVGERGEGFKYMLTLMNNARIGVGFECLGLCEAATRMASDYAAERRSMGKPIAKHEMIADFLDEMSTDTRGIRALAVHCAVEQELAQKTKLVLESGILKEDADVEKYTEALRRSRSRARRLTPLLKYLASEKSVELAQRCIQIHGGVGYTKEFGAEKLLRDAMVMPIYEGTSQIQSLMAMKDTLMGAMKNPTRFAGRIATTRLRAASARDPLERRVAKIEALSLSSQQHLLTRTAADKLGALKGQPLAEWPDRFLKHWDPKTDFSYAMLHAERLTQQLADEAVCKLLLEQAKNHPERRALLVSYLDRAEPRARYLNDQITTTGQRILEQLADPSSEEREAV